MSSRSCSGPPDSEELVVRGLRLLLRGGTWQGLTRELAWSAVRLAGAEHGVIDWLVPLVEARLAERVDGLEFGVDAAARRGRGAHVRRWPHDLAGADIASVVEGERETLERLGDVYLEQLRWATALVAERMDRGRRKRRLPRPAQTQTGSEPELPPALAEALARSSERFGWPDAA